MKLILAPTLAMFLLSPMPAIADRLVGMVRVVDGDTLKYLTNGTTIRLHGIDALESAQTCMSATRGEVLCGEESTAALESVVYDRLVECIKTDTDPYGRWIATCWADQLEINDYMVASGMALAFRKYDRKYIPSERHAREQRAGIWQYTFHTPWEYRQIQREADIARAAAPRGQDCVIKGNISRKDKRIYHLPGTRHYDITSINASKGERWFCTEQEARQAGWTKAG